MYSFTTVDGSEEKKAKGVKKCVVERNIRHEEYLNVLDNEEQIGSFC